jgi:hypothetical protein
MKKLIFVSVILGCFFVSTNQTWGLPPCAIGSDTCQKTCIWGVITWQLKRVAFAPHRAVTGPCVAIDSADVDGPCGSNYDFDWRGNCTDYTGDTGDRVTHNCEN